jgi:MoxR-like ATPase
MTLVIEDGRPYRSMFESIDDVQRSMERFGYITDKAMATTVFLSYRLQKPLFLEGEAGVGKTEVAKVVAQIFDTKLIRLQCYEGLDAGHALYEWNFPKQMLYIRLQEALGGNVADAGRTIYSEEFLIKRPLLEAITMAGPRPPVLLIDEVDRADEEFEAFLLEVLSDFQVTIPEIGTVVAKQRPFVVLTSNRTREVHDALKRRCLYLWISYPSFEREYQIVRTKVPGIGDALARQVTAFMQEMRRYDFFKRPGIAETLDWATALLVLNRDELDRETVEATLGCIFKYHEDVEKARSEMLEPALEKARAH